MVEQVKYISFSEAPDAPRVAVPYDFTNEQIRDYLKSDYVKEQYASKGYAYEYGLQPVNQLELDNLDDYYITSGAKKGWLSAQAIGQQALAWFNDAIGNEEAKEEALTAARQYMLDKSALAYQVDDDGKLLPRIETLEDIYNDERHLYAFTRYVREKFGEAAATSIPTLVLGALGAGIGSIVPGVGTALGATAGTLLSGFIFGLGETYGAQAEETEDPNLAIAVALGIPYAAVERLGIGGVIPSLIKTFGGDKKKVVEEMAKSGFWKPIIKGTTFSRKNLAGQYITNIGKTGLQEGLAESIQESITTLGGGLETDKGFEELFLNKDFAKQLAEAAAAGFFGGMPFGTISPSVKALNVINRKGGVNNNIDGSTLGATLNDDPNQEAIKTAPFDIGNLVTVEGKFDPDISNLETPLFGKKPTFRIIGTTSIEGEPKFVLQSEDIKSAVEFVGFEDIGRINIEEEPSGGGEVPEQKENFAYDGPQTTNKLDDASRKQHTDLKRKMVQTGRMDSAQETEVTKVLGGDQAIINNTVSAIITERQQQKEDRQTYEATPQEDREGDVLNYITKMDRTYAKYDGVPDNELETAIAEDLPYWRTVEFAKKAEGETQEVFISEGDKTKLENLGFFGDRGQTYIQDRIISATSPVNKTESVGLRLLKSIIKNGTRFSSIPDILGGPILVQQKIGEKISKNEPLSAQEKASLSGDRIIPATKYNPSTYTEGMTFEDLYDKPVEIRIRIAIELAGKLDKDGWKRKIINDPQIKELEKAYRDKVRVAEFQFGKLSESYKQAKKDLADFRNTGEHVLINGLAPKGVFSLVPILSPTALKTYQSIVKELEVNLNSQDPVQRKQAEEQIDAYYTMIAQTIEARTQLNELLKSMSIEPILDWNKFTEKSLKNKLSRYKKKLEQNDVEFKKKDIISQYTMLNNDPTDGDKPPVHTAFQASLLQLLGVFRTQLDAMGLENVDIGMMKHAASQMLVGRPTVKAAYLGEEGLTGAKYIAAKQLVDEGLVESGDQVKPNVSFGVINIAFDIDRYNNSSPAEKQDMISEAFSSLHHEAIHALKDMGLFTKKEWAMLTKASLESFIKDYNIKARYPRANYSTMSDEKYNDMIIEEGIASAMQSFLAKKGDPSMPTSITKNYSVDNTLLNKLFNRIKAFLSVLGFSLKQTGFLSPYEVFDSVSTGIIGQRIRQRKDIQQIYAQQEVNKTMAINPMGALVSSNAMISTDINLQFQKNFMAFLATDGRFRTLDEAQAFIKSIDKNSSLEDKLEAQQLASAIRRVIRLDKVIQPKFEATQKPKFKTDDGIGSIQNAEPYNSMYAPMTVNEFLALVPRLDRTERTKTSLKYMADEVQKGRTFGVPYIEIELNPTGGIGRVTSHEGRHRATMMRALNNGDGEVIMPVAIRFKRSGDPQAYIQQPYGRDDIQNKNFLSNFLREGILVGQGGTQDVNVEQNVKYILPTVYNSFETDTETNEYTFSQPYNNNLNNNPHVRFETGEVQEPSNTMNRQQSKQASDGMEEAANDMKKSVEPGASVTPRMMSAFSRFFGHARSWAKNNPHFRLLFANVMNKIYKSRELQMSLTAQLRQRYLEVKKDPAVAQMLNKAHIIMEMTGQFPEFNENGELVFIAPEDGGASDLTVTKGEIVALTGDVALAMKDHQLVMAAVVKEHLKADISRDHVQDILEAIEVLNVLNPSLPELQTVFNFEGMTQEQIIYALENLSTGQIRLLVNSMSNLLVPGVDMRRTEASEYAEVINKLLGSENSGLNKLLNLANEVDTLISKPYVPLQRFGDVFIKVTDADGNLLWFETFEGQIGNEYIGIDLAMRKAKAKRPELIAKYPGATVSQPAKMTIESIRQEVQNFGQIGTLEYITQFMTDTNARNFQEAIKEARQIMADKKIDKYITPLSAYRQPRNKTIGAEGVPGYSADFTRATLQYIMTASDAIARNRYHADTVKHYFNTLKDATERGDIQLQRATKEYFEYSDDPVQEFASFRRLGFWWYLGGNISSAFLQTFSLLQFAGPILSQVGGTAPTLKELTKAVADAGSLFSISKRQYEDAFLDFEKIKEIYKNDPDLAEALYNAVADGTIKQGQAMQEAGIVPGAGGSEIGTQAAINKNFRKFENIFVGGTFNTFEALSRITAFVAAYKLAKANPKVLENAELLYGNDLDYQNMKDRHGNSPEAFARFMVEETFGVYGKENRPKLARGFGSLPALFMTYISQMFGLLYRLLNPVGMAGDKTRLQNKVGRRAFARVMLMMLITGGIFGLPGGEDAEDIYNIVRRNISGVDKDVRQEFREMLYNAGFGPKMIEALESGLFSAYMGMDIQRRVGFGVAPWSTQVRAALSMAGVDTGARAEEFLGAPGSVFLDSLNNFATLGVREGRWGDVLTNSLPLGIRNPLKGLNYAFGQGYITSSYGQVITDDIKPYMILMQTLGFTPNHIAKNREYLNLIRRMDNADRNFKQRINARLENAYVKMIIGGKNYNGQLINEGQAEIQEIYKEIMKHNQNNPTKMFIPNLNRKFEDALKAVNPDYAIYKGKEALIAEKFQVREIMGLN